MELDLLKEAIRLSQSGQKEQARSLLSRLVQSDPANEIAWVWLIDACDSDAERKAILNWGLQRNPQSKMLSQAMQRIDSIQQKSDKPHEKQLDPSINGINADETPSADLDWLRSEDLSGMELDEVSAEDLSNIDTIPDEEFSRLSQQFFSPLSPETETKQAGETVVNEKKEKRSLFDFLNRESVVDELEPSSLTSREENELLSKISDMGSADSNDATNEPAGIEDKLKDAFIQAAPVEKRRRFFLQAIPNAVKKVLFYLGISFLLIVLVLVGLFIIDQYFATSALWQQLFAN